MNNSPDILQFRNISHSEYKWAAITNESLQLLSDEVDNPAALSFIDDILNYENSPTERYSRINHLLNTDRSAEALVLLNDLSSDYNLNTAEEDELQAVMPLYALEADLLNGLALSNTDEGDLWALINSPYDQVMMKAYALLMGYSTIGTYDPLFDDDGEHALKSLRLVEIDSGNFASLYPNPVEDFFILKIYGRFNPVLLKINSTLGQEILSIRIKSESAENFIDVHELVAGMYFVTIFNEDNGLVQNLSFIKK